MMLATIRRAIKENGEWHAGRWGTFAYRFSVAHWRWAVALCKFEESWSLHLFCLWITLWKTKNPPEKIVDSWGVDFYPGEAYLRVSWGKRSKTFYMPWAWDHCRLEVMLADGRFVPYDHFDVRGGKLRDNPEPSGRFRDVMLYTYTLRDGGRQYVEATVTVERLTWVWRWFRWLGRPRMVRTSIDIEFSDEVGERRGSWKGGTIGCGYEMLPGETPQQTLRRMERERKFE
jgi:hypothetical protein